VLNVIKIIVSNVLFQKTNVPNVKMVTFSSKVLVYNLVPKEPIQTQFLRSVQIVNKIVLFVKMSNYVSNVPKIL
jgi:hypothetical protein